MSPEFVVLVHSYVWAVVAMFAGVLFETGLFGPETTTWLMAMFMISNGVITSALMKRGRYDEPHV